MKSDYELLAEAYSSIVIGDSPMAPKGTGVGQQEYYPTTDAEKSEIPNTALDEPEINNKKDYTKLLININKLLRQLYIKIK